MRVLLVEDDDDDALITQRALTRTSGDPVEVVHVTCLAEALEWRGGGFDAMLLDLSLPDASGLGLIERVLAAFESTPVVILSGMQDEALAMQAVRRGAQDYLLKGRADGEMLARALRYAVERRRGQLALARREHQLAEAQAIAQLGSCELDLATGAITFSAELYRIFGLPPDQPPTYERLVEMIHPDDRARIQASWDEMVRTLAPAPLEHRIVRPDGEVRWVASRGSVFPGEDGKPARIAGTFQDVTERKLLESLLRDASERAHREAELLDAVLKSAGEGIVVTDENGHISMFNPAAAQIVGVSAGDHVVGVHERAQHFGIFRLDGKTPFPTEELPVARAQRGLTTDGLEMFVRNSRVPEGHFVLATGRPIFRDDGRVKASVQTFSDVTALKGAQLRLAEQAITDELTGLPNVRALRERLTQLAHEGARGRRFALAIADVDHFKRVNDTYGHQTGDEVLAHVAGTLRKHVRRTDFVARYGGEEFVVLFTDVDEPTALRLADKLRQVVRGIAAPVPVTCSFGVCANEGILKDDVEGLLAAADAALYRAKRDGRDRVAGTRSEGGGRPQPQPPVARGTGRARRGPRPCA